MKKLLCLIFGHLYYVRQRFGYTSRRVGCRRCCADWGMHDSTQSLIEWDGDLEQMYSDMGYHIIR